MSDATRCPHCGQAMPGAAILSVDALVCVLRDLSDRAVYRTQAGRIAISYRGGFVSEAIVQAALASGHIKLRWPDTPGYWELNEVRDAALREVDR